ncbi:MAG: hypothetical protein CMB45_05370 [Euryarchaeota archaeon]|mgnify:FL=1|nr:hypothetical protein [Euryarchaeota archaeon]MBK38403.1 hypothetical protein [Euryarchaeota archaeon]|tara:strand:- start:17065 stop:18288 length:1224 start_codon:yes stop_codon:yes gene_type:complete
MDDDFDDMKPSVVSATWIPEIADSRKRLVREDKRAITVRSPPGQVSSGESVEVLNIREAGDLVSLKVVVDNPYASVFLEIDDWKNREPRGETPAELLMAGRTNRADKEFFVIDKGPDGGYTMVYNPKMPEKYNNKLRIVIHNGIKPSRDVFGNTLRYSSRGGLPTPATNGFAGGGTFQHTGLGGASLATMANAMANPIGSSPYTVGNVYNQDIYDNPNLIVGTDHPYQGIAGKPIFTEDTATKSTTLRIVFSQPGQKEAGQAGGMANAATPNSVQFPGNPTTGSESQIGIYLNTNEIADAATPDLANIRVGSRLFIRNGDTIHFPGVVTHLQREQGGEAVSFTGSEASGAYLVTLSPGLQNMPAKFDLVADDDTKSIGIITSQADTDPKFLLKSVELKRIKRISYDG